MWSLKEQIPKVFEVSLKVTVPEEPDVVTLIATCAKKEFGDYQCNNAMGLWSKIKGKGTEFRGPQSVGQIYLCISSTNIQRLERQGVVDGMKLYEESIEYLRVRNMVTVSKKRKKSRCYLRYRRQNWKLEMLCVKSY
ncbi:hypothetical protein L2E82_47766 [Cichorium intybus]|uniref:Uncharacterized protein n=1 Tax=Cichorium intybus TaxID=13427 RepID=A0ACB8YVN0_CICIN|nr:hypothetical protein L2E82_47766 [Cichorium intybus]